jgi:hypothetical protein
MAQIKLNDSLKGLRGSINRMVFRTMPNGDIIVSGAPDQSRRKPSSKQTQHWSDFQQATRYAKLAARTEPVYAALAQGTGKSAYNFALSDWFHPPVIHQIQCTDGRIRVQATDNVMVTKLEVTLLDEHGGILEQAEALRAEGDWWEYVPSQLGQSITATARDLAGNVTKFDL